MEIIAGDIAGIAALSLAGGMGEFVPDAGTGTIGQWRTFDLVGGGSGTPEEISGKKRECSHGREIKGERESLKLAAAVVELMLLRGAAGQAHRAARVEHDRPEVAVGLQASRAEGYPSGL